MTIIHPLDSLLDDLFPEAKGDGQKLIEAAKRFYSFGPFKPQVSITDNMLIVEVNTARIDQQKSRYDKVLSLCERGQFAQAKKRCSDPDRRSTAGFRITPDLRADPVRRRRPGRCHRCAN